MELGVSGDMLGRVYSGKYNREVLVCSANLRLSCDLSRKLSVRQTGTGEDQLK